MLAGSTSSEPDTVMKIDGVKVYFTKKGFLQKASVVKAVDGITLNIRRGEVLALVGESGSGKTTLGRAAIGLTRTTAGSVTLYDGAVEDVGSAKGKKWKQLRKKLQIIFQDPFSSIDPNMRVYDALRTPLSAQGIKDRAEIHRRIEGVMRKVGLPDEIVNSYVFQLSGGQRQRVGIARVLLLEPVLVVADEPVSMLDASLKGDILHIIGNESKSNQVSFIFITHDLAVARVIANRIAVMYLGKVVELGSSDDMVGDPLHPYTKAILQASPTIDPSVRDKIIKVNIVGELAKSTAHPTGCKFHPRCPFAMAVCKTQEPPLEEVKPGHLTACWLYTSHVL